MLIFKPDALAEKVAVWAYLFLCITVVQQIYELRTKPKKQLSLKTIFRIFSSFEVSPKFWMKNISDRDAKIIKFCVTSLTVYVFGFLPLFRIYNVLPKFFAYYPSDYLRIYILTLIIPEVVLVFVFLTLSYYWDRAKKGSGSVLFIFLLLFNISSGKIVSKSIEFEFKPRIISISPTQTTEAWTDIVVTGKNFRDIPFVGKIYLNDIEQGEYLIYWSDERIVFRTSPTLSKSGFIYVSPLERPSSNKIHFEYNFK